MVALLEPLQEGGALTAAASRALEELIIEGRSLLQAKLKGLPPLPQSVQASSSCSHALQSIPLVCSGAATLQTR